jgi:hypothetical protein
MFNHRKMLLNPKYGFAPFSSLLHMIFFDSVGPIFQLTGILATALIVGTGHVKISTVLAVLSAGVGINVFLTLLAIHLEEHYFARHHSLKKSVLLVAVAVAENFGYRQLIWWWKLEALILLPFSALSWGKQKRTTLKLQPNQTTNDKAA